MPSDNHTLAMLTAILSLRGDAVVQGHARDAVEIGRVFGIEPSDHTEKELGIVNPFSRSGDDLAILPGRKVAV